MHSPLHVFAEGHGAGVILNERADLELVFYYLRKRVLLKIEDAVAVAREGVHAAADVHAHAEDLVALDGERVDKLVDGIAKLIQRVGCILELIGNVLLDADLVAFEVEHGYVEVVV